jgi:hypothetical protein
MTKTLFILPAVRRSALSCVWIETGNPRQPLACVWIDDAMRIVTPCGNRELRPESVREPRTEPVSVRRGLRLACA